MQLSSSNANLTYWTDRVEALGVGTALRKLTVDSLAKALVAATSNSKQILRAKAVGEEIRKVNTDAENRGVPNGFTGERCSDSNRNHLQRLRVCEIAHQSRSTFDIFQASADN